MARRARRTVVEVAPVEGYTPKSKAARTRGADAEAGNPYLNRPTIDTPGFLTPKERRWRDIVKSPEERHEMYAHAYAMGMAGCTDAQIAEAFGITRATLWNWKTWDPKLAQLLEVATEVANRNVEASLYHKAMGYTFESEDIKVINDVVVRVPTKTHIPPDNTAMVFWLKNKAGWRDVQQIEDITPPSEAQDVRRLALGVLALLQQGMSLAGLPAAQPATIEHESDDETEPEPAQTVNKGW